LCIGLPAMVVAGVAGCSPKAPPALTPAQLAIAKADEPRAMTILTHAAEILNDDDLWAKAVKLYSDPKNHLFMNQSVQYRDHYRTLVNKVLDGLKTNPPVFVGDDGSGGPGGTAYVKEKGGSIYLRGPYFDSTGNGRAYTLIHEYGRRYLWDELPKDGDRNPKGSITPNDLEYVETWDQFITLLGNMDYLQIKR
jgi:hypothetical protein